MKNIFLFSRSRESNSEQLDKNDIMDFKIRLFFSKNSYIYCPKKEIFIFVRTSYVNKISTPCIFLNCGSKS